MPSDEDRIYDLNAQLKQARAVGNVVGEKAITAELNSLLDRYPRPRPGAIFDGLIRTVADFAKYDNGQ